MLCEESQQVAVLLFVATGGQTWAKCIFFILTVISDKCHLYVNQKPTILAPTLYMIISSAHKVTNVTFWGYLFVLQNFIFRLYLISCSSKYHYISSSKYFPHPVLFPSKVIITYSIDSGAYQPSLCQHVTIEYRHETFRRMKRNT